jgi:uncharacterized membrane protein YbaN (DUF454 family)
MLMLMVAVRMDVLMGVHRGCMAVLMPVVGMSYPLMRMLVFVLVFAVATHNSSPPFEKIYLFMGKPARF